MISIFESCKINFKRILFSDEVHLQGYVNKHNWRFWGRKNPRREIIRSFHSCWLMVWCAISVKGGQLFKTENVTSQAYMDRDDHPGNLNICFWIVVQSLVEELYMDIWNNSAISYLYGMDKINDYWFMQDDARPSRTHQAFDLLADHFDNGIIRRFRN